MTYFVRRKNWLFVIQKRTNYRILVLRFIFLEIFVTCIMKEMKPN